MKKILFVIIIFGLFSNASSASAQASTALSIKSSPDNISLTQAVNNSRVDFDFSNFPDNAGITDIKISYLQNNSTCESCLIKLLDEKGDLIGAKNGNTDGTKQYLGLLNTFIFRVENKLDTSVEFFAEDLTISEVLIFENIQMTVTYTEVVENTLTISNIEISDITNISAIISFETSIEAKSSIKYGRTSSYTTTLHRFTGSGESTIDDKNEEVITEFATIHRIQLSNLSPGVTYHFQIQTEDKFGNIIKSNDRSILTSRDASSQSILGESIANNSSDNSSDPEIKTQDTDEESQNVIDVNRLVLFIMAMTLGGLIVGYFFGRRIVKFIKGLHDYKGGKNLFRDPEFIKKEFEKNEKNRN